MLYDQDPMEKFTPVTYTAVPLHHVLRVFRRHIFTGITAQISPSPSAVRGQLRTRPT